MSDTITVPWPTGGTLDNAGWRQRLEDLAGRAEALVGQRDVPVHDRAVMALEWVGLAWPALSPELIAGSARASLLLNEPVVMASDLGDQVAEIHEALDAAWDAARRDPAAGVVQIGPPLLERVRTKTGPKPPPPAPAEPEPPAPAPAREPADDPDDVPAAWLEPPAAAAPEPEPAPPAPAAAAPAPPAPAPPPEQPSVPDGFASAPELALELGAKPTTIGAWATRRLEPADIFRSGRRVWFRRDAVVETYEPRSKRRRGERQVPGAPAGWFSTAETIELVGITASSVGRWRMGGRFGNEGEGWVKCGSVFFFAPDVVERLMEQQPADLDQLLDQIRA